MNVTGLPTSSLVSYKEGMSRHATTAPGFGNVDDFKQLQETAENAVPGSIRSVARMDPVLPDSRPETPGSTGKSLGDTIKQIRDQNLAFEQSKPGDREAPPIAAVPPGSIVDVLA